jgi:hypothetical protein
VDGVGHTLRDASEGRLGSGLGLLGVLSLAV